MAIIINEILSIPDEEVDFETSLSGGPGGQHVNKTESAVTLSFAIDTSSVLSDFQKRRLHEALGNRITKDGILRVSAREERSQHKNKALAIERFAALLADALKRRKVRRKIRVSRNAKKKRVATKRRRGDVKRERRKRFGRDD